MMTETVRDWRVDPQRMADMHVRWGASMLTWLDTTTGSVLDAGCGSGRVTELLLDHLPDAHVVAVDSSQDRLDEAAVRLAGPLLAGRLDLVLADLTQPLPVRSVD